MEVSWARIRWLLRHEGWVENPERDRAIQSVFVGSAQKIRGLYIGLYESIWGKNHSQGPALIEKYLRGQSHTELQHAHHCGLDINELLAPHELITRLMTQHILAVVREDQQKIANIQPEKVVDAVIRATPQEVLQQAQQKYLQAPIPANIRHIASCWPNTSMYLLRQAYITAIPGIPLIKSIVGWVHLAISETTNREWKVCSQRHENNPIGFQERADGRCLLPMGKYIHIHHIPPNEPCFSLLELQKQRAILSIEDPQGIESSTEESLEERMDAARFLNDIHHNKVPYWPLLLSFLRIGASLNPQHAPLLPSPIQRPIRPIPSAITAISFWKMVQQGIEKATDSEWPISVEEVEMEAYIAIEWEEDPSPLGRSVKILRRFERNPKISLQFWVRAWVRVILRLNLRVWCRWHRDFASIENKGRSFPEIVKSWMSTPIDPPFIFPERRRTSNKQADFFIDPIFRVDDVRLLKLCFLDHSNRYELLCWFYNEWPIARKYLGRLCRAAGHRYGSVTLHHAYGDEQRQRAAFEQAVRRAGWLPWSIVEIEEAMLQERPIKLKNINTSRRNWIEQHAEQLRPTPWGPERIDTELLRVLK